VDFSFQIKLDTQEEGRILQVPLLIDGAFDERAW
jgi:hypothetical protein